MFENKLKLTISHIEKLNFLFAVSVAISFPFLFRSIYMSYAINFFVLTWVLQRKFAERFDKDLFHKNIMSFFLPLLYYLVLVIGMFYTQDTSSGLTHLVEKLTVLLLPVIFIMSNKHIKQHFKTILLYFVGAVALSGLICFIIAFWRSSSFSGGHFVFNPTIPGEYLDTNTAPPSYFFYHNFSFFLHPTYFSMYITFALGVMFYFRKIGEARKSFFPVVVYLFVLNYFVDSKAGIILGFLVVFSGIVYLMKNKIIPVVSALLLFGLFMYVFSTNSRFFYVKKIISQPNFLEQQIKAKDYRGMVDLYGIIRIPIWFISTEIVSENMIFGVGTGDAKQELLKKYDRYNLYEAASDKLNAHNQYLETLIQSGFIGFSVLLLFLFVPLIKSIKRNDWLMFLFMFILIYEFLFESMLNRVQGIVFVAFFYSLLLFARNFEPQRNGETFIETSKKDA